jgi:RimJ/RimL family protein N-acetyltransferase
MAWPEARARLEGSFVVLEPLAKRHGDDLWQAAQDAEIWTWLNVDASASRAAFDGWLADALTEAEEGSSVPFATVWKAGGRAIGSTRFLEMRPEHRRIEIGWTWLAPTFWGTGANVEAKLLMFEHAFERLACRRVELKTDARNERSRGAMAALPAQFEGIMRKHMVIREGLPRDSAYYSVVDDEWPAVRANLERRLEARMAR